MALDQIVAGLEWAAIVVLVGFSGLFSGLNLGLMSLDTVGLEIVMASDNAYHVSAAKKIKPLRDRGNWLLCTLLLGNVAVNAALSILLADKTDGLMGFILSTALIVIFGEIIPQAICSRYALEIGAKTVWIVWPLMFLMAIIAYPIAYILDVALGEELGTIYSNKELSKLVDLTQKYRPNQMHCSMASMLKGALQLDRQCVVDIYTEMNNVFWLNEKAKLSFDIITKIFRLGHSRIPVFRVVDDAMFCIGLIYVKDLILVDPDDNIPITKVLKTFEDHHQAPIDVWKEDNLQEVLQVFINTAQHLAFVKEKVNDAFVYIGIITLEDVIEEILKTDLVDEYDKVHDKSRSNRLKGIHSSHSLIKRKSFSVNSVREKQDGMVPIPVRIGNNDRTAFISSPNIMNKPFMNREELSLTFMSHRDEVIDESKHSESIHNHRKSTIERVPQSTARIRSIPEIKSYLEHFIPKLSFSTTILCLFIKPLLICLNVFFIVYMFYGVIFANFMTTSLQFEGSTWKKQAIYVMIIIEFSGLIALFLSAIICYFGANYAMCIDCIRWSGSWSIFQLFYTFQPLIIIEYLSIMMGHFHDDCAVKRRIKKWKTLRDDLKFEMKTLKDEKMKECLSQLEFLINLHENNPDDLKNINIIRELKKKKEEDLLSINSLSTSWNDNDEPQYNDIYNTTLIQYNIFSNLTVFNASIVDGSTWLIFVFGLIFALCCAVFCLILKLSLFGFIVTLPISEWNIYDHWVVFLLFINQIWNMIDVDCIRVSAIYQFLFIDCSVKYSKYISQRMSILDAVIKEQLWSSFQYRGFLLALSLNDEIVHKIIVNKSYDLSTMELIKYRKLIEKRIPNKAISSSNILRTGANWIEMVNEQQPYHPYVVIRQDIDKYYNSLDALNGKILITIKYRHNINNYHEYKLAVKAFTTPHEDGVLCEDGEVVSLYKDHTLSRKSRTRSELVKSNIRKREQNKLLLEMQKTNETKDKSIRKSIHKVNENTLLNEMILFDSLLSHCSKITRWINIIFIALSFVMTAMSILLFASHYIFTTDECTQKDMRYISIISVFDIIFFVFCLICLVLVGIYRKLEIVNKRMLNLFCGVSWLILTSICFIRFSYFFALTNVSCQLYIINTKSIFFIAVLSAGYLAFFQSFVVLTVLLHWISLYSSITWLVFMIFVFVSHIILVIIFYVVGWNFVIHLITQTIASLFFEVEEGDLNRYCQVRFIFSILMVTLIVIYLIIGAVEFFWLIKITFTQKDESKKKLLSNSNDNNDTDNNNDNIYYDIDLDLNGFNPKYIKLSRSRVLRKLFVGLFYFMALLYTIIHDIINETSVYKDVHLECQDLDFGVAKSPIFYHNYSENLFVFIMLIDLVLFGELFESYRIVLDPIYWFAKLVWKRTNNVIWSLISLIATCAFVTLIAVVFIKYDVGLL